MTNQRVARVERRFALPDRLAIALESMLKDLGFPRARFRHLASAVERLSDHFISPHAKTTPWREPDLLAAYLAYFFPLNAARLLAVAEQTFGQFPQLKIGRVLDYGSGPGLGHILLNDLLASSSFSCCEISREAVRVHQQLAAKLSLSLDRVEWVSERELNARESDLAFLSYSLNELAQLPKCLERAGSILIVEPSTQIAGRKLMQLRQTLIDRGFQVLAPCTHQQGCPLLLGSPRDWCHDRVHFSPPDWFAELEQYLPMKNQTLTFSYLFASRQKSEPVASAARIVGDTMNEKGKARQMVCRGPDREFLAWMKKSVEPQTIARGLRVRLPENLIKVSNEIRVDQEIGEI